MTGYGTTGGDSSVEDLVRSLQKQVSDNQTSSLFHALTLVAEFAEDEKIGREMFVASSPDILGMSTTVASSSSGKTAKTDSMTPVPELPTVNRNDFFAILQGGNYSVLKVHMDQQNKKNFSVFIKEKKSLLSGYYSHRNSQTQSNKRTYTLVIGVKFFIDEFRGEIKLMTYTARWSLVKNPNTYDYHGDTDSNSPPQKSIIAQQPVAIFDYFYRANVFRFAASMDSIKDVLKQPEYTQTLCSRFEELTQSLSTDSVTEEENKKAARESFRLLLERFIKVDEFEKYNNFGEHLTFLKDFWNNGDDTDYVVTTHTGGFETDTGGFERDTSPFEWNSRRHTENRETNLRSESTSFSESDPPKYCTVVLTKQAHLLTEQEARSSIWSEEQRERSSARSARSSARSESSYKFRLSSPYANNSRFADNSCSANNDCNESPSIRIRFVANSAIDHDPSKPRPNLQTILADSEKTKLTMTKFSSMGFRNTGTCVGIVNDIGFRKPIPLDHIQQIPQLRWEKSRTHLNHSKEKVQEHGDMMMKDCASPSAGLQFRFSACFEEFDQLAGETETDHEQATNKKKQLRQLRPESDPLQVQARPDTLFERINKSILKVVKREQNRAVEQYVRREAGYAIGGAIGVLGVCFSPYFVWPFLKRVVLKSRMKFLK